MVTTGAWVDEEEDIMRSDSLTVLIESDPIAAAAVMNDQPSSDVVRAQQEELEVHPLTLESIHTAVRHGNSNMIDSSKLSSSDDTEKLLP